MVIGPSVRRFGTASFAAVSFCIGTVAQAQPSTPASAPAASHAAPERVWASCMEHLPSGASRPKLTETFPARGLVGYAVPLQVTVEHGKGETVLPQGFQVQSGSDAARALSDAGFSVADPNGGSGAVIVREENTDSGASAARTRVTISFVPLTRKPGRHLLELPPVPIAVARASGEIVTLCTEPHRVLVESPTASTPNAEPRPNPPPRVQREDWVLARQVAIGALAGAVLAALGTWLLLLWLRRPRPVPPPPPPRPPWEIALEELRGVRFAGLVSQGRFAEHFDRVSDALRKYLGGRYGFDGLETTTREMKHMLRTERTLTAELPAISAFLDDCDLVKFARYTPSESDCARVLDEAERIVQVTVPGPTSGAPKEAA